MKATCCIILMVSVSAVLGCALHSSDETGTNTQGTQTEDDAAGAGECARLGESECASNVQCYPVEGQRVAKSGMCKERKAFAACVNDDPERGCRMAFTTAVDPKGNLWEFPNGCTPPGWSRIDGPVPEMDDCPL